MEDCTFCRIYNEEKGIIYENDFFYAQFDSYPVTPGHVEIIPIRHVASLLNLKKKEWQVLKKSISEVIDLIEEKDLKKLYRSLAKNPLDDKSREFCEEMLDHPGLKEGADGYNIGINEGRAAGRTIDHLHVHIIPRYHGDVKDPTGGVRNVIPKRGNYKK